MAKFYGVIGFAKTEQTTPGVWEHVVTEKEYFGELIRNVRNLQTNSEIHDNINIANEISILSDPYANENFHSMLYIVYMGSKWKIIKVEVQYPRLVLTIGGVYNE